MRIKYLKVETIALIEKCRRGDRKAQRLLYETYADRMLGICRRYMGQMADAEDALIKGFVKVFRQLDKLQDDSKFDFWIRRIMANECLMMLRKKKKIQVTEIHENLNISIENTAIDHLAEKEILDLIDSLPIGYKTIFNLYVIEGFKHREIAEQLNISSNTSKSQLIMARRKLQELINQRNFINKNRSQIK